jgi:hypothetical protein
VREPWASRVTGLSRARISAEERNPARAGSIIGCGQGSSPLDRPEVVRSSLATETSHPGVFAFTCYYERDVLWVILSFLTTGPAIESSPRPLSLPGQRLPAELLHTWQCTEVHAIESLYRRADMAKIMNTASWTYECTQAYFPWPANHDHKHRASVCGCT